jgi:hypothetical protein
MLDLAIRHGTVVTATDTFAADVDVSRLLVRRAPFAG